MYYGNTNNETILMNLVQSQEQVEKPGDFYWSELEKNNQLVCWVAIPTDRFKQGWILTGLRIRSKTCIHGWDWDNNKTKPTFDPALHVAYHWYGIIRDGVLIKQDM